MKVLHVIDTLEVGGAEKSISAIIPRLRSVQSVVCQLYPGQVLAPVLEAAGVRVISLGLPGRYSLVRASRAVSCIVRGERVDLIHATLFRAGMAARIAGAFTRVPVVDSFVSDSYSHERYAGLGATQWAKLRAVQFLDALTAPLVARFLAVSSAVLHSNCRALGVAESRCVLIPRGRDPAQFSPLAPAERRALRMTLGWDDESAVILNVARFLHCKGQEHLIRAFPEILSRWPSAILTFAGDGPARKRCEGLARDLGVDGRISFLGTREDVPALLQAADVFAFPSLYEGIGGAMIEAMFAASPIVATDIPAHRESIVPGATGLLVPPAAPAALAHAVSSVLADRVGAKAMGARARAVASERFAIDRIARRYDDLYCGLAREAGR